MIFVDFIQSVKEFIFEVFVWIILFPKTLLRVVFAPARAAQYINAENKKPAERQFDEYLHPAFFFLAAILFRIIFHSPRDFSGSLTDQAILTFALQDLIIFTFYLAWLEWLKKRPLKRSTLKRPFYVQCYLLGAVQFLETLALVLDTAGKWTAEIEAGVLLLIIVYEAVFFRAELKTRPFQSVALAVAPMLMFFAFIVVLWGTGLGKYIY